MRVVPRVEETERKGIDGIGRAAEAPEAWTNPDLICELLGEDWQSRVRNPLVDPDAERVMLGQREVWAREGKTVVMTSGAYDLLHLDHAAYLLDTKLQGAPRHYQRHCEDEFGRPWDELPDATRAELIRDFLARDELKLVVSVDGNEKIARRKSGVAEKGGGVRPILDWQSRAHLVAALAVEVPGGDRVAIADIITINDPVALEGSACQDMFEQAAALQPDVWAAYHESTYIFEGAPQDPRLQSIELRRISQVDYFGDALLTGKAGTTAILRRIQGE